MTKSQPDYVQKQQQTECTHTILQISCKPVPAKPVPFQPLPVRITPIILIVFKLHLLWLQYRCTCLYAPPATLTTVKPILNVYLGEEHIKKEVRQKSAFSPTFTKGEGGGGDMMKASVNINQSANHATVCWVFGQPSDALVHHPGQCVDSVLSTCVQCV